MSSVFTRRIVLGLCAGREGYLIGRNDRVRALSNRDMGRFLERAFVAPGG
jgi:hypothetical protein